jgi:hypothetical protein
MPEGPWAFGASPRICPATLVCALQWAACQSPTKRLASYFEESTKPESQDLAPDPSHTSRISENTIYSRLWPLRYAPYPKIRQRRSSRCLLPTLTMIVWGFWPLQSHFLQTPLWQTPLGTFIERLFAYWCARRTRTNPKGLCRRSYCCGLLDGQMAKVELYEGG